MKGKMYHTKYMKILPRDSRRKTLSGLRDWGQASFVLQGDTFSDSLSDLWNE